MTPDILLGAARIGEDGPFLQIGQDLFHHRHDLQDRRAQKDNIGVFDHRLDIRRRIIDSPERHRAVHRGLGAAKACDVDILAHLVLEAQSQ